MNAVSLYTRFLDRRQLARIANTRGRRSKLSNGPVHSDTGLRLRVLTRYGDDLAGFLNACTDGQLAQIAACMGAEPDRLALWLLGADREAGGTRTPHVQPIPHVLGGRLVQLGPPQGAFPPTSVWPRLLPPPRPMPGCVAEPQTLDELLQHANRALGVRLGERGADKGAWGTRAATMLGVMENGVSESDWRGDVELKTVSVVATNGGWRIAEDPAIAMVGADPMDKLRRVLWLVRAPVAARDATLLSWYFTTMDAQLVVLARRHLHTRPKGPRGRTTRAWYLHKRFFADSGLLATLNGWQP